MSKAEAKKAKYWNAFGARLMAFGLGKALASGFVISGNEDGLKRLNEFLRKEMPEIADDDKAISWYVEKMKDLNTPRWSYGPAVFRR